MPGDGDTTLLRAPLSGPQLEDGWRWVRKADDWWRFGQSGLEFATKPGCLAGQTVTELPAPPLLLRELDGATACEVTVTMPPSPGAAGEQAGLFWYINDDNYAKLVIERMQDRTGKVVLARKQNGEYTVCNEAALDVEETQDATRLRFEMSADDSHLSGCVVGSYYTRLIGSCTASAASWGDNAQVEASLSFGISAHGRFDEETLTNRVAVFSDFTAIAVKKNRVQWANAEATVSQAMAAPVQSQPLAPPVQDGYEPPAPSAGGWTLSDNLSAEQRSQIATLLGQNGLPALD